MFLTSYMLYTHTHIMPKIPHITLYLHQLLSLLQLQKLKNTAFQNLEQLYHFWFSQAVSFYYSKLKIHIPQFLVNLPFP